LNSHSKENPLIVELEKTIAARYPLVYLYTPEETRTLSLLSRVAETHQIGVIEWTCTDGFQVFTNHPETDPVKAVQWVSDSDIDGFYVFKDLAHYLGDPIVIRALRDAYVRLREKPLKKIIIISSELEIPTALQHSLYVVDVPPPDENELQELIVALVEQQGHEPLQSETLHDVVLALTGLTLNDTYHLICKILYTKSLTHSELLLEIQSSKKNLSAGTDCLEYVAFDRDLTEVAGFQNFKQWMSDRADIFNQASVEKGIPFPRGVLIMGVSGCGKSLCAKAIPQVWNVPLFRLDMNLVFSGSDGTPQHSFHKALKTIESMAPVVLWIDEIENGLGTNDVGKPSQSQIFSAFLTWMQEKPPLVFVVATANRIEYLPAEMIRKGRFDQVFFVDLPNDAEREEMLDLSLQRNGVYTDDYDMKRLVSDTKGWNGAEIDQVIESARVHALSQNREFSTADIVDHALNIVPLSQTMHEQIKALKDWAWDRATPASVDNRMMVDIGGYAPPEK